MLPLQPAHDEVASRLGLEVVGEQHVDDAAGRGADVEGLGLDEAGIKVGDRGLIEVDGAMRTSLKGVYAIGDIVHGPALAHKASDEGVIAAEDAAGMDTHPIEYDFVPRVTFCSPQVASFGLTEDQAREAGHDVVVGLPGERAAVVPREGEVECRHVRRQPLRLRRCSPTGSRRRALRLGTARASA